MSKNQKLELTGNSFYNLQNIFEVIVELGEGAYTFEELLITIDRLFNDFSRQEKIDLAVKVVKISTVIN